MCQVTKLGSDPWAWPGSRVGFLGAGGGPWATAPPTGRPIALPVTTEACRYLALNPICEGREEVQGTGKQDPHESD